MGTKFLNIASDASDGRVQRRKRTLKQQMKTRD
jgi:hypothetical protein